jgi:hypothetical protein
MCNNHPYVSPYLRRKLRSYAEAMGESGPRSLPPSAPARRPPESEQCPNGGDAADGASTPRVDDART